MWWLPGYESAQYAFKQILKPFIWSTLPQCEESTSCKVWIVAGPSGCGKTEFCRTLASWYNFVYINVWEVLNTHRISKQVLDKEFSDEEIIGIIHCALQENGFSQPFILDRCRGEDQWKKWEATVCRCEGLLLLECSNECQEASTNSSLILSIEQQADVIKQSTKKIAEHYHLKRRLIRASLNSCDLLGSLLEVQKQLHNLNYFMSDPELEEMVPALLPHTLDCIKIIGNNLLTSRSERHRSLNTASTRFERSLGQYPFAMRVIERLGFTFNSPNNGVATVVEEVNPYIIHLVLHLIDASTKCQGQLSGHGVHQIQKAHHQLETELHPTSCISAKKDFLSDFDPL